MYKIIIIYKMEYMMALNITNSNPSTLFASNPYRGLEEYYLFPYAKTNNEVFTDLTKVIEEILYVLRILNPLRGRG
jgi:hypothetical protein